MLFCLSILLLLVNLMSKQLHRWCNLKNSMIMHVKNDSKYFLVAFLLNIPLVRNSTIRKSFIWLKYPSLKGSLLFLSSFIEK